MLFTPFPSAEQAPSDFNISAKIHREQAVPYQEALTLCQPALRVNRPSIGFSIETSTGCESFNTRPSESLGCRTSPAPKAPHTIKIRGCTSEHTTTRRRNREDFRPWFLMMQSHVTLVL
ncbi:hypothetical protein R1flu_002145 [Riccia fluitans]|uniref:Uncharacterized protein n=1 Tax=Riccia fluitans TaxID=41844 RepID=A0ABD1Y5G0_9MARC